MRSVLFLIAFAVSASCCGYADDVVPQSVSVEDVVPQSVSVEDVQVEAQIEGQTLACECEPCSEEACKCGCTNPEQPVACSRCGKPHAVVLAGCGCKNKKSV